MKFKIGDEVICVDNSGVEGELTVGLSYTVLGIGDSWIELISDNGWWLSYFDYRFKLSSPTDNMVDISQNEYDAMYDRIELLESLLVDANNRVAELEEFLLKNNKLLVRWVCR